MFTLKNFRKNSKTNPASNTMITLILQRIRNSYTPRRRGHLQESSTKGFRLEVEGTQTQRSSISTTIRTPKPDHTHQSRTSKPRAQCGGARLCLGKEESNPLRPRPGLPDQLSLRLSETPALEMLRSQNARNRLHASPRMSS